MTICLHCKEGFANSDIIYQIHLKLLNLNYKSGMNHVTPSLARRKNGESVLLASM